MTTAKPNIEVLNIKQGKDFLSQLPDVSGELTYVVIGAYCWGKDTNAAKAAKNARFNGGKGKYTIHLANKDCEVDQVDGTLWHNSKMEGVKTNLAHFNQL
jgi:hypothetical protein